MGRWARVRAGAGVGAWVIVRVWVRACGCGWVRGVGGFVGDGAGVGGCMGDGDGVGGWVGGL